MNLSGLIDVNVIVMMTPFIAALTEIVAKQLIGTSGKMTLVCSLVAGLLGGVICYFNYPGMMTIQAWVVNGLGAAGVTSGLFSTIKNMLGMSKAAEELKKLKDGLK